MESIECEPQILHDSLMIVCAAKKRGSPKAASVSIMFRGRISRYLLDQNEIQFLVSFDLLILHERGLRNQKKR